MATKKDELDYTKQPQATNQAEVDAQDARTRLYQSLGYSYGQQQEQSDKSYDQAISQTDRAMLGRGMQRSSYNIQTQANLQDQKAKERNRIGEAFIADYQSRLSQLEENEANRELQREQFQATQDYNYAQLAQQKELTQAQMAQNETQFNIQQAFNEKQWEAQQAQWREQFDYSKMGDDQKMAYNYIVAAAAQDGEVTDDLLARAGLSREDYNAMRVKAKSSGGGGGSGNSGNIPEWKRLGFSSETDPAYLAYLKLTQPNEGDFESELGGFDEKPAEKKTGTSSVTLDPAGTISTFTPNSTVTGNKDNKLKKSVSFGNPKTPTLKTNAK